MALSLAFALPLFPAVIVVALAMAAGVTGLTGRNHAGDTALGVLSHAALATGMVAVSFVPGVRTDLMAYLFGDILAVTRGDLATIWLGAGAVVALLARIGGEEIPRETVLRPELLVRGSTGPAASIWLPAAGSCAAAAASHSNSVGRRAPAQLA